MEIDFNRLRCSEKWISRKRRWKSILACLSTNGILVSTNFGFIRAAEEPRVRPDIYSFGVNVSCIPVDALKSAKILEKRIYGSHLYVLLLEIARGKVSVDFAIPFDGSNLKEDEGLVRFLSWGRRSEKEVCIL